MASRPRGGRSARRPAVLAALALAVAGCGETEGIVRGGSVIGETLTVYSVLPRPDSRAVRDVVDGERLALREAGGRAGEFKVNFTSLDSTGGGQTGAELPGQVASATRQAIADPQVIAVVGDLKTETAQITVPLLNSAGILHVSPLVSDPRFTTGAGGEPEEPERFYPAGERTFFIATRSRSGRRPDRRFRAAFRAAFGRAPRPQALAGYEAMRTVLGAIEQAGAEAGSRQAVIDAYRARD